MSYGPLSEKREKVKSKKKPLYEVYRELAHAKKDLVTVSALMQCLEDGSITEVQMLYLMDLYPNPTSPKFKFWREHLDLEKERIEMYIENTEKYLKTATDPRRQLPKKKQRQLGLLPPV